MDLEVAEKILKRQRKEIAKQQAALNKEMSDLLSPDVARLQKIIDDSVQAAMFLEDALAAEKGSE